VREPAGRPRTDPEHNFDVVFDDAKDLKVNWIPIAEFRAFHITLLR
jgi:hypothetical protein